MLTHAGSANCAGDMSAARHRRFSGSTSTSYPRGVNDAVIISTARTAIGTAYKGSLVDVDALELGTAAVAEAVGRARISPELVDDGVLGGSLFRGREVDRYVPIEAEINER